MSAHATEQGVAISERSVRRLAGYVLAVALFAFVLGLVVGAHPFTRGRIRDVVFDIADAFSPPTPRVLNSPGVEVPLETSLVNFDLGWVNFQARLPGGGGGLAVIDEGVLIARPADGTLLFLDARTNELARVGLRLPAIHRDKLPNRTAGGREINSVWLRYNDLETLEIAGRRHLLASYSFFNVEKNCFTSRLALRALPDDFLSASPGGEAEDEAAWAVVYETSPCLPFFEGRNAIALLQAGGRMVYAPDGFLYLTVGDFEFDGVGGKLPAHSQVPGTSYGKIWRFKPGEWQPQLVSMGHRNPQGITALPDGSIWAVEHGPQGGDELNHIRPGLNFGWPYVTMGVNYVPAELDSKSWPFNPRQGRHEGFEPPVYAWVPSIGISNIKYVQGVESRWDGDLLVSSLNGLSLYRLRMADGHVLSREKVEIGHRIRYVEIGHGRIYLLTDDGLVGVMSPHHMTAVQVSLGQDSGIVPADDPLTEAGCHQCHSSPGAPRLALVHGADIASQAGVTYSQSLLNIPGRWDNAKLRAFLSAPEAFAPGTIMPPTALSDEQLDAIIRRLAIMARDARKIGGAM